MEDLDTADRPAADAAGRVGRDVGVQMEIAPGEVRDDPIRGVKD